MSDSSPPAVQPHATTLEGMKIEQYARELLSALIVKSVAERREYGGVIWRNDITHQLGSTQFAGYSGANVDIGVWNTNQGCPKGTTAVTWYHTHPTTEVMTLDGKMSTEWESFIGGDKLISDSFLLPGFVGTMDMRFWRYDPPPAVMVNGKPVVTEGKGTYGPLNGKLVPPRVAPPHLKVARPISMPPLR